MTNLEQKKELLGNVEAYDIELCEKLKEEILNLIVEEIENYFYEHPDASELTLDVRSLYEGEEGEVFRRCDCEEVADESEEEYLKWLEKYDLISFACDISEHLEEYDFGGCDCSETDYDSDSGEITIQRYLDNELDFQDCDSIINRAKQRWGL